MNQLKSQPIKRKIMIIILIPPFLSLSYLIKPSQFTKFHFHETKNLPSDRLVPKLIERQGGFYLEMNHTTLIWQCLSRINKEYAQMIKEKLSEHQMTEPVAEILACIYESPGMTQNELSRKMFVTKGNTAQLVKKMESSKLIYRQASGRVKRLYLTEKGTVAYFKLTAFLQSWVDDLLQVLDEEEQKTLLHLLNKLDRTEK